MLYQKELFSLTKLLSELGGLINSFLLWGKFVVFMGQDVLIYQSIISSIFLIASSSAYSKKNVRSN